MTNMQGPVLASDEKVRRCFIPIVGLALLIAVQSIGAFQSPPRPDFSGSWVSVPERTRGVPSFGREFTAEQNASELVIVRTVGGVSGTWRYKLDGSEGRNGTPAQGGGSGSETVSKATWDGSKLAIVTSAVGQQTPATRPPVKRILALESDGSLIIETITDLANPKPVPSVYRKVSKTQG